MKFVCLWSGPRNVSTALMYSMAQRPDAIVVDEPLYGHYLRVSGARHPGRDEVLQAMPHDGNAIMRSLLDATYAPPVALVFIKQMAHHLVGIDPRVLDEVESVILIRDPAEMLPSLTVQLPEATLADTGLATQWSLFSALAERGRTPTVLDSAELLRHPEAVLTRLCQQLDIAFSPAMLQWAAGPRPEDGVWAHHWYAAVHQSTGFAPYRAKPQFPESLRPLLAECEPYYQQLVAHAIRPEGDRCASRRSAQSGPAGVRQWHSARACGGEGVGVRQRRAGW